MSIRFFAEWTDVPNLAAQRQEWQALAQNALDPNPFYEPGFLIAAQAHLAKRPIRCLVVRDSTQNNALCALFPLERPILRDGLLGQVWSLYRNPYSCLATPLIRKDDAPDILTCALATLTSNGGPHRLLLPILPEESGLLRLLRAHISPQGLHPVQQQGRAIIASSLSVEEYQKAHWSKSTRSNLARKRKKLEELGVVEIRRIPGHHADAPALFEQFLALEAKSWKGQSGTALACHEHTRAFAHDALSGGEGSPQALLECLLLDDRPIAINLNLIAGRTGYTVKTAYDPDFAAFSPGTLLDAEAPNLACAGGMLEKLDSCAAPGHPIERLWAERETLSHVMLDLKPGTFNLPIGLLTRWMELVRQVKSWRYASSYTTKPSIT